MRRAEKRGVTVSDRLLDHRDPAARDAARVALVERRHDLVLEQRVERLGVGRVDRVGDPATRGWPSISQPFVPV